MLRPTSISERVPSRAVFTIDLSQCGKSDGDDMWIVPLLSLRQAHHGGD
jgi:hypothetical protein